MKNKIIQHRRKMSKIKYQNRRKRQNQYPNLTEMFSSIKVDLCQLLIVDIFIYIYIEVVVVWWYDSLTTTYAIGAYLH
jgi:hypothetical protein